MTGNASLGYQSDYFSAQATAAYSYETVSERDGTPSFQLGNRIMASGSMSWMPTQDSTVALSGSWTYSLKNKVIDQSVPQFSNDAFNANSQVARGRISYSVTADKWQSGPFGTFLYRAKNAFDPRTLQYIPAKTLWSAGEAITYAASEQLSINASVERYWAVENSSPDKLSGDIVVSGSGLPALTSNGWRAVLGGTWSF
jgi:hypothetical protein